ncbi:MAG: chromosome segregation protein SMC, partial [Gammaproteobacteria bacterium]|nr:chromosome segregation protein SMC [Gammaproteobacteria bacterium]
MQARYYGVGADISRTEQQIQFARETREAKRRDLAQSRTTLEALAVQIARDEQELVTIRDELARLAPEIDRARHAEGDAANHLESAEHAQADWQRQWESFNQELGTANQTVQVERARIEQLENQLRRLRSQRDRLDVERDALLQQEVQGQLFELGERESQARTTADGLSQNLATALAEVQRLRASQLSFEEQLESARSHRERVRAEVMSVEALQRAALGQADARANEWLRGAGLADRQRVAETLTVESGYERAVETVLGDYLEAVCVGELDGLIDALAQADGAQFAIFEGSGSAMAGAAGRLSSKVQGPAAVLEVLESVRVVGTLGEALEARRS